MLHPFRILLAGLVATSVLPSPCQAAWKPEPMSQSYVNLGCGSDAGTVILSINTGTSTSKYLVTSTSPLFKSAFSITTKAVANDRRIQVYTLSNFPTVQRSYTNEKGTCSQMSGIDLMGIGFDVRSSSTPVRRQHLHSREISVSLASGELRVVGAKGAVELVTIGGRLLARRVPDAEGSAVILLKGLPRGVLLVRSGDRVVTVHNP